MKRNADITVATRTYLASALFTPTVIWIAGLNRVLLPNLADIPYSLPLIKPYVAGLIASAVFGILIAAAARNLRWLEWSVRVWVGIGLAILLCDVAAAISSPLVQDYTTAIIIDVIILVVASLAVFTGAAATFSTIFSTVALVLIVQGIGQHAYMVWRWSAPPAIEISEPDPGEGAPVGVTTRKAPGNVYHVLLDGFQSEVFDMLLDKNRSPLGADDLDGFTYYPNFYASYFMTFYALPHLFTGAPYDPGEHFHDWRQRAVDGGLLADLARSDTRLWLYTFNRDICPDDTRYCASSQEQAMHKSMASIQNLLLDLWFNGLIPRSLEAHLAGTVRDGLLTEAAGVGIVKDLGPEDVFSLSTFLGGSNDEKPRQTPEWRSFPGMKPGERVPWSVVNSITSVQAFQRMLKHEREQRPSRGQYVFIHLVVPHTPHVLDNACAYKGPNSDPKPFIDPPALVVDSYTDQARCALRLTKRLLSLLKQLGRYEDSLVIVHADHGMDPSRGAQFRKEHPKRVRTEWGNGDDNLTGWRKSSLVGLRSHALLLVKPSNSHGELKRNDTITIMSDIAPTILNYTGTDTTPYPGIPLDQIVRDGPTREIVFYAGEPTRGFFQGLKGPDLMFPAGNAFSKFVLNNTQWSYTEDVPVK